MLDQFRAMLVEEEVIDPRALPPGPLGAASETGPFYWGDVAAQPPAPKPLRVIPLAREVGMIGNARVALLSLELWTDHLSLRFAISAEGDDIDSGPLWTWRLHDDTGTLYKNGGGSSGGSGRLFLAENEFLPVPPQDAKTLTFVARKIGPVGPPDPLRMVPVDGVAMEELFRVDVPLN